MITLSTGSIFFIFFLIIAPVVLRNNSSYRRYIFLFLNLIIYIAGIQEVMQLIIAVLWICLPYFIAGEISKRPEYNEKYHIKSIVIGIMVAIFAYLMQYSGVFSALHIPFIFGFRLLGLSYLLFREIDFIMQYEYLVEADVKISFVDYINYVTGFYCLLAGPILRYEEYVQDFYKPVDSLDFDAVCKGLNRAVNGYIKVYVISAILSFHATNLFDGLKGHSNVIFTIGAFVIFALLNGFYIYFNFSGYCDIVIAFASLAGLTVHENFNRPYLARSVVEFWNRHHITLSEWIRDYIFSPMFKMLISGPCQNNVKLGQYISLFLTFTIAGIWHGTDMNYLIYGLFQGLGIVVATVWKDRRKKLLGKERNKQYEKSKAICYVSRCVTWTYICLTFSFVGYDVVGLFIS